MSPLQKFFEPRRRNWSWQKTGLVWGSGMFVFTQVMRVIQAKPFLWPMLVFDLIIWTLAGIAFGLMMRGYARWRDARNE
jgi:hypothetical protein